MRIVGGKYKGRVLNSFAGKDIRPTSDMVRESVFNILQFKIYGTTFLDLFCGTGAMGIEALSRGAKSATFVDASKESLSLLKRNLEKCKVEESYQIKNIDSLVYLDTANMQFDYVYIDPPYCTDLGERALSKVAKCLAENGLAILESEKPFDKKVTGLEIIDKRKYGKANLTFFKREN